MLASFPAPVLAVAADAVRDLQGRDALCGLWTLFTKCKESLHDGRRLENIAWRLWYREMSAAAVGRPPSPALTSSSPLSSAASYFGTPASPAGSHVGRIICDILPSSPSPLLVPQLPTPPALEPSVRPTTPPSSRSGLAPNPQPRLVLTNPTPIASPHPTPPTTPQARRSPSASTTTTPRAQAHTGIATTRTLTNNGLAPQPTSLALPRTQMNIVPLLPPAGVLESVHGWMATPPTGALAWRDTGDMPSVTGPQKAGKGKPGAFFLQQSPESGLRSGSESGSAGSAESPLWASGSSGEKGENKSNRLKDTDKNRKGESKNNTTNNGETKDRRTNGADIQVALPVLNVSPDADSPHATHVRAGNAARHPRKAGRFHGHHPYAGGVRRGGHMNGTGGGNLNGVVTIGGGLRDELKQDGGGNVVNEGPARIETAVWHTRNGDVQPPTIGNVRTQATNVNARTGPQNAVSTGDMAVHASTNHDIHPVPNGDKRTQATAVPARKTVATPRGMFNIGSGSASSRSTGTGAGVNTGLKAKSAKGKARDALGAGLGLGGIGMTGIVASGVQKAKRTVVVTSSEYESDSEDSSWASEDITEDDEVRNEAGEAVAVEYEDAPRSRSRSRARMAAARPQPQRAKEREREKEKEKEREREKEKKEKEEEEVRRQREMFVKMPHRSYSSNAIKRTMSGPGLLTRLLNPDIAAGVGGSGVAAMRPQMERTSYSSSDFTAGRRVAAAAPAMVGSPSPRGVGLHTSKSAAALPSLTVTVAQIKGGVSQARTTTSGGHRPKGRPMMQELEDESDGGGDPEDVIQVSASVAQRKLAVLAGRSRGGGGAKSAVRPQPHITTKTTVATTRAAVAPGLATITASPVVGFAAPIPLGHPYNLPAPTEPSTPRTTRRMMLQTEMSESMRRNLLWERQTRLGGGIGRRHGSTGVLGDALRPLTSTPSMVQLVARGTGGGGREREREGRGETGEGVVRNRSWADDYHYRGW